MTITSVLVNHRAPTRFQGVRTKCNYLLILGRAAFNEALPPLPTKNIGNGLRNVKLSLPFGLMVITWICEIWHVDRGMPAYYV